VNTVRSSIVSAADARPRSAERDNKPLREFVNRS
jgi:hypothetical protein